VAVAGGQAGTFLPQQRVGAGARQPGLVGHVLPGHRFAWAGADLMGGLIHDVLEPQGVATARLYGDLVQISALVVLAMGLRFWARRVEKASAEGQKRRRVTLRRALLLYRFDRPAARIVRIVFYLWTLSWAMWAALLITDYWA